MPRRDKNPDASKRYHDRVARRYDSIYDDDAYWEFHDRITWESIRPHIPTDASARCCDLGCGTGKWGLKLLKSGFPTTFVDHSPNMIQQVREKLSGIAEKKAELLVADVVDLSPLQADQFSLTVAMGDVLSICFSAAAAAGEMFRTTRPGGIVIATADNKLAAIDHYLQRGDLDELEKFLRTGRTHWLTDDKREQFELTTMTPTDLKTLFERAGFEIVRLIGKTVLPIRAHRHLLEDRDIFDRLLKAEQSLQKSTDSPARAAHLQITARRPT